MSVPAKVAILIDAAKTYGYDGIPPAERRRLAVVLRWLAAEMDPDRPKAPKAGLLLELKAERAHE